MISTIKPADTFRIIPGFFMDKIRPDVLIQYMNNDTTDLPTAVIYVRPKTNLVKYEKEILVGLQPYADVIYLANLNGKLFIKNALILEHYSTQYKFSIMGKEEVKKYSEMKKKIEKFFDRDFDSMKIIGAFDAMLEMNLTADALFNIIVEKKDFLKLYGQTIKKVKDYYIVNYNIPAILEKYTPTANIFVVAVRLKDKNTSLKLLDQSIFENIQNDKNTPIIDEDKLGKLKWNEKIRRTYHISRNHIIAMFDMMDFVFKSNGDHIKLEEIPFAKWLFDRGNINEQQLLQLKDYAIVYIRKNRKKKLVNILEESMHKNFEECEELLKSIIWEDRIKE